MHVKQSLFYHSLCLDGDQTVVLVLDSEPDNSTSGKLNQTSREQKKAAHRRQKIDPDWLRAFSWLRFQNGIIVQLIWFCLKHMLTVEVGNRLLVLMK